MVLLMVYDLNHFKVDGKPLYLLLGPYQQLAYENKNFI